jgi:hypothetical protein
MEAPCSSETSVDYQRITGRYIPEDRTVHNHVCENFRSHLFCYLSGSLLISCYLDVPRHYSYFQNVFFFRMESRDSSVGIATGYGLGDRGVGVRVPGGSRIFSSPRRPDRFWGPPSLLSNGYRGLSPGGKAAGV